MARRARPRRPSRGPCRQQRADWRVRTRQPRDPNAESGDQPRHAVADAPRVERYRRDGHSRQGTTGNDWAHEDRPRARRCAHASRRPRARRLVDARRRAHRVEPPFLQARVELQETGGGARRSAAPSAPLYPPPCPPCPRGLASLALRHNRFRWPARGTHTLALRHTCHRIAAAHRRRRSPRGSLARPYAPGTSFGAGRWAGCRSRWRTYTPSAS
jgi:hypothetical protein